MCSFPSPDVGTIITSNKSLGLNALASQLGIMRYHNGYFMRGYDKWGANKEIVESLNQALKFLCHKNQKKYTSFDWSHVHQTHIKLSIN